MRIPFLYISQNMVFIVQNRVNTLNTHIQPILQYPTTSTPVALDVCHGRKPRHLRDTERVVPMPWVHQPPVATWLQENPLTEPWVSCESNTTSFPACFVGPSLLILPPPHLPSSSVDVEGSLLVIVDPCLWYTNVY
jgi:hypothetical protein